MSSSAKRTSRKRLSEVTPGKSAGAITTPRTPRIVLYNAENEKSPQALKFEEDEAGATASSKKHQRKSPNQTETTKQGVSPSLAITGTCVLSFVFLGVKFFVVSNILFLRFLFFAYFDRHSPYLR